MCRWYLRVVRQKNRQNLKLSLLLSSVFSGAANLRQQLVALQQESKEEQHAFRREVMKLRDQIQQASKEGDKACAEVQRLRDTVETAAEAKVMLFWSFYRLDLVL